MSRPPLPFNHANPQLKTLESHALPPVKYQILTCQGQDILVGRMKIPTPSGSGHAFILRRFDTGAISLTTMFRAAFPEASDLDEKRETSWVKEQYDLSKNNGSSRDHSIVRLAGVWVSTEDAVSIAESYALGGIVQAIARAVPDPSASYRRSGRGADRSAPVSMGSPASRALPSPPPTSAPASAKRRKDSSPPPPAKSQPAPASLTTLRRSNRTKSASPAPVSSRKSTKAPRVSKGGKLQKFQESDEAAFDEDAETTARMGEEMFKEDVAEQRALIANLKAHRDDEMDDQSDHQWKRGRDEAEQDFATKFNFQEPGNEERAIATNSRVSRFHLEPKQKSFAWGVAVFAFGLGAATLIPSLNLM